MAQSFISVKIINIPNLKNVENLFCQKTPGYKQK
jgi:hypothetical protein